MAEKYSANIRLHW